MKLPICALLLIPLAAAAQEQQFDWNKLVEDQLGSLTAFYTAEELYTRGKGQGTMAYIVGVVDADYSLGSAKRTYCLPDKVSVGQVYDVAWKYFEQNPKYRHFGAAYLVRRGLTDAWPCNK